MQVKRSKYFPGKKVRGKKVGHFDSPTAKREAFSVMGKRKGDEEDPPRGAKEARGDSSGSAEEEDGAGVSSAGSPEGDSPTTTVAAPPFQLRTSVRVLRRRTEERKESESEDAAAAVTETPKEPVAVPVEKPRRAWEQWSSEDMAIFFEGLNEYGKNFELIQTHFQSKSKNRGVYKTREQIRTFYYRTWHKISPYVDFKALLEEQQEHLKKSSRELYGLINYGELRKKLGSAATDERNLSKLHELVFKGHTTLRARGRTHRVRTPICRTLKRLASRLEAAAGKRGSKARRGNGVSSSSLSFTLTAAPLLPSRIRVELKPLTTGDFFRVHGSCFQNPHMELRVDPSTRLAAVIDQLEKKWASLCARAKVVLAKTGCSTISLSVPAPEVTSSSELWITAPPGTKVVQPILTPMKPVTSATLCLENLAPKLGGSVGDVGGDGGDSGTQKIDANDNDMDLDKGGEGEGLKSPLVAAAGEVKAESTPILHGASKEKNELRTSWTKQDANALTMGELYLMLGCYDNRKMTVCYGWKVASNQTEAKEEADQGEEGSSSSPSDPFPAAPERKLPSFPCVPSIRQSIARLATRELARRQQNQKGAVGGGGGGGGGGQSFGRGGNHKSPVAGSGSIVAGESTPTKAGPAAEAASSLSSPSSSQKQQQQNPTSLSSPTASTNGHVEFRRPINPPIRAAQLAAGHQSAKTQAFRQQLEQFLPKFSNRRGRPSLSRKNVISRQLLANRPMQPKNYLEANGVKLRLLQNSSMNLTTAGQAGSNNSTFPQAIVVTTKAHQQQQQPVLNSLQGSTLIPQGGQVFVLQNSQLQQPQPQQTPDQQKQNQQQSQSQPIMISILEEQPNGMPEEHPPPPVSPTGSISSFFNDASLSELAASSASGSSSSSSSSSTTTTAATTAAPTTPTKGDHFLDCMLENSNNSVLQTPPRHRPTPPSSPSRALGMGGEPYWPPELSISSFLSNLGDSPNKGGSSGCSGGTTTGQGGTGGGVVTVTAAVPSTVPPVLVFNEDSSHSTSSEVDRQLLSMMTENSVDFTAKFSKLAAHVSSEEGD